MSTIHSVILKFRNPQYYNAFFCKTTNNACHLTCSATARLWKVPVLVPSCLETTEEWILCHHLSPNFTNLSICKQQIKYYCSSKYLLVWFSTEVLLMWYNLFWCSTISNTTGLCGSPLIQGYPTPLLWTTESFQNAATNLYTINLYSNFISTFWIN